MSDNEHFIQILETGFDLRDLYGDLNPVEDIKIDHSNLQGEFVRQPALMGAYGYLTAEAERAERLIEYQLSRMYAVLDQEVRRDFVAAGEKLTEKKIENTVITKPDYQQLKLELIDAKKNKQLFRATCQALNHKLQALINAGADHRKTFNDVRIVE